MSIHYVEKPIVVSDSRYKHKLEAGNWVSTVHSIASKDLFNICRASKVRPEIASSRQIQKPGSKQRGMGMCDLGVVAQTRAKVEHSPKGR